MLRSLKRDVCSHCNEPFDDSGEDDRWYSSGLKWRHLCDDASLGYVVVRSVPYEKTITAIYRSYGEFDAPVSLPASMRELAQFQPTYTGGDDYTRMAVNAVSQYGSMELCRSRLLHTRRRPRHSQADVLMQGR